MKKNLDITTKFEKKYDKKNQSITFSFEFYFSFFELIMNDFYDFYKIFQFFFLKKRVEIIRKKLTYYNLFFYIDSLSKKIFILKKINKNFCCFY